jgi:hypothetical protein
MSDRAAVDAHDRLPHIAADLVHRDTRNDRLPATGAVGAPRLERRLAVATGLRCQHATLRSAGTEENAGT